MNEIYFSDPEAFLSAVPLFARGHRLHHDKIRNLWMIQAPEKALILEGAAPDILLLVDGKRNIADIVDRLRQRFASADNGATIQQDVVNLLRDLMIKEVLRA